jgi:uncharacterized protein DUF4412
VTPTRTLAPIAIGLWLMAAPLAAADGILIVQKTTSDGSTQTHQIQIEKSRMRAEGAGQGPEKQVIVFDGAKQILWMINYDRKTYSEITKDDVDRMAAQLNDVMSQVQSQLGNLPPEQRARIEAMMRGRSMAAGVTQAKTEYRKTGSDKVGKWTCDKYEGYRSEQKVSELCTVEPQALGFTAGDFDVSRQLAAFFAKMVPQGADRLFRIGTAEEQGFSGVPVRQITFSPRQTTSELSEVSRQNFPASTFEVPAGFTKEASPFAGRGRGRQ